MTAVKMVMVVLYAIVIFFLIPVCVFQILHHEYLARCLAYKMHSTNDFLNKWFL